MNFAYPNHNTYVTHQKTLNRTPLSTEAKERRNYIRNHKFIIDVDAKTQECSLIVTEKRKQA